MYERLAAVLKPVHGDLVERLAPRPGEAWLDVGSGAGSVALRAARAGARVSAIDSSAPLAEQAHEDALAAGLEVSFAVGNVEYLPYEDAEFDVIASAFGFISASDHANVAGELARVARSGARLGFTAWKPNPKLGEPTVASPRSRSKGARRPNGAARTTLRTCSARTSARVRRRHTLDRRRFGRGAVGASRAPPRR